MTVSEHARDQRLAVYAIVATGVAALLFPPAAPAQQIEQSVEAITVEILDSLQSEGKAKVAIIEFTDLSGSVTPLGRLIAEELASKLFKQARALPKGSLTLVERSKLDEVLGEQRLGVRGLLEKRNVETFGRVLGVEAILTGTFAVFDDRIRINARMIAVPSAELFATASGYMGRLGLPDTFLRPESADVARPDGAAVPERKAVSQHIQETQGVRFDLVSCGASGDRVTCDVTFKSLEEDVDIRLNAYMAPFRGLVIDSRVIDEQGNEYMVSSSQVGARSGSGSGASLLLGVPLKAQFVFEGIPATVRSLAAFEFGGKIDGERNSRSRDFRVQFRDVVLDR